MNNTFITDQIYKDEDFSKERLPKGDYDNCSFIGCNFSDGFLDNCQFLECRFESCNLSNANIAHTTFKEVQFIDCKMVGLLFERCNQILLSFSFKRCTLDFSSFRGMSIPGTLFDDCKLRNIDFSEADLSRSHFTNSILDNSIFDASNLQETNFSLSHNIKLDPERNQLKNARFSQENVKGLLAKYKIQVIDQ
ncbi:MAG: pentapeptide repeat-containing protein [Gramella sp.]|nr:pentapeptide repeat-containing protein [Christiangramia sp.]